MQKKQSFMKGVAILMFSQIIVKLLGLIYKLYLTNKDGFGDIGNAIYSSGFQIYALLLTVSSVGVPNAVSKLISEKLSIGDETGGDKIFKVSFMMFALLGFISSVLLFVYSKYISIYILEIPEAELTLKALAPSIFFVSIISVLRGKFNATANMKPTANSQTIEQLSKTILTILIVEIIYHFARTTAKTTYMAAGANLATTLATIISFYYLFKYYKKNNSAIKSLKNLKSESTKEVIKNILLVAMPITISVILGTLNKNIDSVTVVRGLKNFLTADEAQRQYGILSGKVDTLVTLPMSLNIALITSLVPNISAAKAQNNMGEVNKKIKISLLLTFLIGLPCTVGMFIFANPVLKLLFPNASDGTFILQISSISIIFILINQTITAVLQGLGKQFTPVIALTAGVISKLIINVILIKVNPNNFILGGTAGACVGTIACYIIALIINSSALIKNTKVEIKNINVAIKPVIATIIMAYISINFYFYLKGIIMDKLATIISMLIAILIYVLLIISMKVIKISKIIKT